MPEQQAVAQQAGGGGEEGGTVSLTSLTLEILQANQ